MKKMIISVLATLLAITLVGCNMQDQEQVEQTNSNQEENNTNITENNSGDDTEEEKDKKIFYLYCGRIVGVVEDGNWITSETLGKSINAGDLFNLEYYTVYNLENFTREKMTNVNVIVPDDERQQEDIINKIAEYGRLVEENKEFALEAPNETYSMYEVQLPLELSKELADEIVGGMVDAPGGFADDLIGIQGNGLVTNSKRKLTFEKGNSDKILPDNVEAFIENYKQKNGIKAEAKYNCVNSYSIDADHDGIVENIYAIETIYNNSEDENYQELFEEIVRNGAYTLLLIEKNGDINIIFESKVASKLETEISNENDALWLYIYDSIFTGIINNIYCADFDQDGTIEIMVDCEEIGSGNLWITLFFDLQDGNYKLVSNVRKYAGDF